MTKNELLNLENGAYITAEINGTNSNGESIHRIKIFKLSKNDYNISDNFIFLNGMQWNYSELRPTEQRDIIDLITQEIAHHNAEIKRLFNLLETLNKWEKAN